MNNTIVRYNGMYLFSNSYTHFILYFIFYVYVFCSIKEIALIDPALRQSCKKEVFEETNTKMNNTTN